MKKLKKNPWIQGRKKFRNFNLRALKVAGGIVLLGVFVEDVQSCQGKLLKLRLIIMTIIY